MGRRVLPEGTPNMSEPEQTTAAKPIKKSGDKKGPLWWDVLGLLIVILLVVTFVWARARIPKRAVTASRYARMVLDFAPAKMGIPRRHSRLSDR